MFSMCGCQSTHPNRTDFLQAKKIWDYMLMNHTLKKSDLILCLGNHDIRTAEHAANLFLSGMGDKLMFSGKAGAWTKGLWDKPEAEVFKDVAVRMGVPEDKIILETEATNTGENIRLSYELLREMDQVPTNIIIVQMPYMERRVYATFMKMWPLENMDLPNMHALISSPNISLPGYDEEESENFLEIVSRLLVTLKKVRDYPAKHFQIEQNIPKDVRSAYNYLQQLEHYNKYL